MKLQCPKCGTTVVISRRRGVKRGSGRLPEHPVQNATRTFARVSGDSTPHFFDYQESCPLSGAWFMLELRS